MSPISSTSFDSGDYVVDLSSTESIDVVSVTSTSTRSYLNAPCNSTGNLTAYVANYFADKANQEKV